MKRILTLLILSFAISAHAQISVATRLDSIKAINDRQITTSTPPNLVYPVQVGSKTDSLCAVIQSAMDTMYTISATTNGLQAVLTNSNVATVDIIENGATYRANYSGLTYASVSSYGGLGTLFLRNGGGSGYNSLYSIATAPRSVCLPDEGNGINTPSTLVTHHTKNYITVDAVGTGDSTVIAQGSIQIYAPPVTTYNMHSWLTPFSLHFGQINTAHTHIDGLTIGFTADGSNYAQNFQNDTGAIALVHNVINATTIPQYEVAFGTGTGITSAGSFSVDPTAGLIVQSDITVNHLIGGTGTPTITCGAGAGSGASATIVGDDMGGYINLTTGTGPAMNAIIFTVTFNSPYQSAPRLVQLTPASEAALALIPAGNKFPLVPCLPDSNAPTTTLFNAMSGGGVMAAGTEYRFWYFVKQ
jgi:hypothetical protein